MAGQAGKALFYGDGFTSRRPMAGPLKVKAVLFDLDNTLIDYLHFKTETARAAASEMVRQGLPVDEQKAFELIFSVYDEKGIEYSKTLFEVIKPFGLEVNMAERIQQAGLASYLRRKLEVLRAYPEAPGVLTEIRKMARTGIVSDAPRNKAWQRLVMTGLDPFFDIVVSHSDTREFKPHPSPFALALDKLGLEGADCLFVGDNPARDILGARRAGMRTAWARYGAFTHDGPAADFELQRLEGLLAILGKA
jgi:putative hydrolase of the HAD superfamily